VILNSNIPSCIVLENGGGVMLDCSWGKEFKSKVVGKVRGWFDGIRFLWQTSETRYLLKLILTLLGLMVVFSYWRLFSYFLVLWRLIGFGLFTRFV